jgi:hypothetical protein
MRAMRRALVLGALVVVGALSAAVAASQQPAEKPKLIEIEKLRDNLFVLRGGGGNTGVFITSTGVVADPRQDQRTDTQTDHAPDQHPHAG